MTDRRSRLAEKIAALRAKTKAAGCTEAEALAAADLAARLMREHGISDAELLMSEARVAEKTSRATWRSELVNVIAYCTNCHSILLADEGFWLFVGREPGPEIAAYLRDVCFRAVAAEEARFKAGTFYRRRRSIATKRQAAADFRTGLVLRLRGRLINLFGPIVDEKARAEAREVAHARVGRGLRPMGSGLKETRFSAAANEGWHAGGSIPLNRGMGGSGPAGLLTGGSK